jgi:tetratricopeptide (TPR) repeat protein
MRGAEEAEPPRAPPEFRGSAEIADGALGKHPRDREEPTGSSWRGGGSASSSVPATKFTLGHLLSLESLAGHVWQDRVLTKDDAYFREAVERTWSPPGKQRVEAEEARNFFHLGYVYQSVGDLGTAVVLYSCSLDLMPTSEAHTFRGWAYSFMGRTQDAIRECEDAVAVDPSFGNPYNDLGAYLIELGRLDEAEEWLERAKRAPRYDALFYPYANLGRLYILKGEREKARQELLKALEINPHYAVAAELLKKLDRTWS